MTFEKQKARILSGEMYDDLTPELVGIREKVIFLTNEYNNSFGKPAVER